MEPPSNWSYEETQALIAVWSEEKIQRDLQESLRNEKVFREVSGRLAAMGMYHSAKQCREKIKKLKQDYRKIKRNCKRSGANGKNFKWFDALDAVLSQRAATADNTEQQSASMILEFIIADVGAGTFNVLL